ncbi:MAG TPA: N-acyl homoserine lactonase family protein [Gaiellaceae bacterium]|nr:N-acyl homoserine lactonase family protein [Gaiellaceae bacterium]
MTAPVGRSAQTAAAPLTVSRLDLGTIDTSPDFMGDAMPIHGYAVRHPQGVVVVDTGLGFLPQPTFPESWVARPRSLESALADHGIALAEVAFLVQTHLHTDHYGENAALAGVPVFVQRAELERARAEERLRERFDLPGVRFELVDGDEEILPGIDVLATPGHTVGHQSVLVGGADGGELLVGDAAYTVEQWRGDVDLTAEMRRLAVRAGFEEWLASLERLRGLEPGLSRIHFSHDRRTVTGGAAA